MNGSRNLLEKYSNITEEDAIIGLRTPFLFIGGDKQFTMMKREKFLYDASMKIPFSNTPYWPFTLRYRIPHKCVVKICPVNSHNIWEMPLNEMDNGCYLNCNDLKSSEFRLFLYFIKKT